MAVFRGRLEYAKCIAGDSSAPSARPAVNFRSWIIQGSDRRLFNIFKNSWDHYLDYLAVETELGFDQCFNGIVHGQK